MTDEKIKSQEDQQGKDQSPEAGEKGKPDTRPKELGGRKGPEPTRYGDWEKNGIISDF